jgi:murein L,D-transpeptidase YcbB/YkuD
MSYLVLNPYWHVPHTLATQDKLPEIKKDVRYLARHNIEVFRGWGADATPVDPSTIDWSTLSKSNFPYRLRQKPGPNNALGRVKFMFPNPHSVYLHDTPSRSLFGRAERSFSSGCIRVERPLDLAAYLLGDQPKWTRDAIASALSSPATADLSEQTVLLKQPLPVHLLYWTAWSDDGTVHFRTDVYDRDAPLLDALSTPAPSSTL